MRDSVVAPILSPETAYWELRLNYHAIQLSLLPPHNTLQLVAIPYKANGEIWAPPAGSVLDTAPTTFVSRDSTKVLVSLDGKITARSVQAGRVFVVATRKLHGIVHMDSALVRIADVVSAPVLDTFHVRPQDGDSAKLAVGTFFQVSKTLKVTAKDTENATLAGLPVYFTSSNASVASVADPFADTKTVIAYEPGNVILRADVWAYGVERRDTLRFTVGYPIGGVGAANPRIFAGGELVPSGLISTVGPGGIVSWENSTALTRKYKPSVGIPIDVIFDDSINVLAALGTQDSGGGNIRGIPFVGNAIKYRRFLRPGTYVYHILPSNVSGTVVVRDQ